MDTPIITSASQLSEKALVEIKTWLEPWFAQRGGRGGGPNPRIDSTENVGDLWGVHSVEDDGGFEDEGDVLKPDGSGGSTWGPAPTGFTSFYDAMLALRDSGLTLLGYWRLGEATGTFADSSGQADPATGTLVSVSVAPTRHVTGALPAADDDGAIEFNDTDGVQSGYIQTATSGSAARFNLGSSDMTLAAWVKMKAGGVGGFSRPGIVGNIKLDGGGNDIGWFLSVGESTRIASLWRIASAGSGVELDGPALAADQWVFVVGTFHTTQGHKLYYNGVLVAANASTLAPLPNNNVAPTLGRGSLVFPGAPYGTIDEVSVWGNALTQTQIQTLVAAGPFPPSQQSTFVVVSVSATYTASYWDAVLATGTFTVNLPTALGATGQIIVKNVGSGTVTVDGAGSETIDGATTFTLAQNASIMLISDGTNWKIEADRGSPVGAAGGVLDGTYPNPGLAAAVAGAGLAETSDVLSVNVDATTIEINADTLRVKDAGIGVAKLTSGAAAADTVLQADGAAAASFVARIKSLCKNGSAALAGAVTLKEGSNVTLTQVGQDITIAATVVGGGAVDSVNVTGDTPMIGAIVIAAGTGISVAQDDVHTVTITNSQATIGTDGWTDDTARTWTYVSASTFTVTGDQTAVFKKGTYLKFTQTTVKYAVVVSAVFGSVTTVTIAVNTDYTLANAAISANYYSYQANPQGWPGWFTYDCVPTGWAATPTQTTHKYCPVGLVCHVNLDVTGTSNATTAGFTVPFPTTAGGGAGLFVTTDNGVTATTPGRLSWASGATTVAGSKDMAGAAWTNPGTKRLACTFAYPF